MRPDPERLRAIPLFGDLQVEQLHRLSEMFTVEEIGESGRRLTPEGASGSLFYVIAEGTAEVSHHDAPVAGSVPETSSARWRSWGTGGASPT